MHSLTRAWRSHGLSRGIALLIAVLIALGNLPGMRASSAYALPRDPIDPDPIGTGPYTPPANGFDWSVPSRFGPDLNSDLLIDYHWDPATATYNPSHVNPASFPVDFDGCRTAQEANTGVSQNTYAWSFGGQIVSGHACQARHDFPAQGTYQVSLTITTPQGATSYQQNVIVKDILIVSIGDSYASGEGNPDVPLTVDAAFRPVQDVKWQDKRCHRSALAGPAQAALAMERRDIHSSVTFLSFACTGATIDRASWADEDINKYEGVGVLAPYRGAEPPDAGDYDISKFLPSQIDQLRAAVGNRQIDALIISGGGNDIYFGTIAAKCVSEEYCWSALARNAPGNGPMPLHMLAELGLAGLPAKYRRLNDALSQFNIASYDDGQGGQRKGIFITEYPDAMKVNHAGDLCAQILDDVAPTKRVIGREVEWAHNDVYEPLNQAVAAAASAHNWNFVGGIAEQFVGHGYCADQHWIRRTPESVARQGPYPADPLSEGLWIVAKTKTWGTLHPNERGHQVYAERLRDTIAPLLFPTPPGPAPTFTVANSDGTLTDVEGAHGWLTGSCQGQTCTSDQVVLTVEANASSPIRGAGVSVNSAAGCPETGVSHSPVPGVTCTRQLLSSQRVQWSFAFTADGIYALRFTAMDGQRVSGTLAHEVRVDLHNPSTLGGSLNGTAGENNWYRSPVDAVFSGIDTPGGSGAGTIKYRVDGGPLLEVAPGEPARINAEGYHQVDYYSGDYAGRHGTSELLIVKIDTITPTATFSAPSGPIAQGGAFTLALANPSDPSNGDPWGPSFSYAFDCGAGYGAFSASNTATCAIDSGVRTVKGKIKDRDNGFTEYSAVVTVSNVAPTATFGAPASVWEGRGFNLSLTNPVDPSGNDTAAGFHYAYACDGGSLDGASYANSGTGVYISCTFDDGPSSHVVRARIFDKDNRFTEYSAVVAVSNVAPLATFSTPATVVRGRSYSLVLANVVDGAGDLPTIEYAFNCGDGAGYGPFGTSNRATCQAGQSGTRTVRAMLRDKDGAVSNYSAEVTIVEPLVLTITAPVAGDSFAANTVVDLAAEFTDADIDATHICQVNWGDESDVEDGTVEYMIGLGTCAASHTYTTPGEYPIEVTVMNSGSGESVTIDVTIVITPEEGK